MVTDQTLTEILNADEYSLRHYGTEICEAIEELQAYRKAMYDARKQAHLFDSGLGMFDYIENSQRRLLQAEELLTEIK